MSQHLFTITSGQKLHVGYVVSTLRATGPTRQLLNLVRHLDGRRFVPHVLTLSTESDNTLRSGFVEAGVPVETLALGRIAGLFRARSAIVRWAQNRGIKLLHTHGIRADTLVAGLTAHPHVATLRNIPTLDYPSAYGLIGQPMAWYHLRALRRVDRVAVVAEASRSMVAFDGFQVDVVRNGVDVDWFQPVRDASEKARLRAELGLSDRLVVITTGRLSQRKNQAVAIEAARRVPGAELVIVGEGECRPELEHLCAEGQCRLVGRQQDVRPWLRAADIYVSTSRAEGLPNAVMEAMACGLPAVLSDIPPHREILEAGDGGAGVLVDGGDPGAVACGIEELATRLPDAFHEARGLVVDAFAADETARRYQALYHDLLAGLRRGDN